jgi:hypothetical protein
VAGPKLWGLPLNVQTVIEHHHRPQGIADSETRRLAELVGVADALNALLVETRAITPELIARIPGVSDRQEVAVLGELIATLPGYLADLSLKATAERKAGRMRSLIAPEPARVLQPSPKPVPLSCHIGGLSIRCQTSHFTDDDLVVSCGRALDTELVYRFTSVEDPTKAFWALVCECQPSGSEYALRLRPFAMDKVQYDRFRALVP